MSKSSGFTLVEVAIVMALAGLVSIGFLGYIGLSARLASVASQQVLDALYNEGAVRAQMQKLEEFQNVEAINTTMRTVDWSALQPGLAVVPVKADGTLLFDGVSADRSPRLIVASVEEVPAHQLVAVREWGLPITSAFAAGTYQLVPGFPNRPVPPLTYGAESYPLVKLNFDFFRSPTATSRSFGNLGLYFVLVPNLSDLFVMPSWDANSQVVPGVSDVHLLSLMTSQKIGGAVSLKMLKSARQQCHELSMGEGKLTIASSTSVQANPQAFENTQVPIEGGLNSDNSGLASIQGRTLSSSYMLGEGRAVNNWPSFYSAAGLRCDTKECPGNRLEIYDCVDEAQFTSGNLSYGSNFSPPRQRACMDLSKFSNTPWGRAHACLAKGKGAMQMCPATGQNSTPLICTNPGTYCDRASKQCRSATSNAIVGAATVPTFTYSSTGQQIARPGHASD